MNAANIFSLSRAGVAVEVVPETGSTNADLLARAAQLSEPVLLVAEHLTKHEGVLEKRLSERDTNIRRWNGVRGAIDRGRVVHGRILEQPGILDMLDRYERGRGRMRHDHELAAHADPDIALHVGALGVEQGDVGADRRHHDDRVVRRERIVDDFPVRPHAQEVGADNAADRQER